MIDLIRLACVVERNVLEFEFLTMLGSIAEGKQARDRDLRRILLCAATLTLLSSYLSPY